MAANRLKGNEKLVLSWIMMYEGAEGISIQNLKQGLWHENSMSINVIWKAVKFLVNEGHICSTIDKMHYLSTHFKYRLMSTDALNALSWIKCLQGDVGISLEALKQGIRGMTADTCEEAVKFLISQGCIHYTFDRDHYMSTDIINNDAKGLRFSLQDLNQEPTPPDDDEDCGLNGAILRKALEYLSNAGLICSSIDGHHYKLTDTINKVLRLIKSQDIEGISLQDLKERLNGTSLPVIRQAVEFLSNEGHIFSESYHNDAIRYCHMDKDTITVLSMIRSSQHVEGISLEDLEVGCGGVLGLPVIWKAVEYLSNEGLIYSTIDQYRYTSSDTINNVLSLTKSYQGGTGISLQELNQRLVWSSMPFIMQAVESLVDDGLIFPSIDGCHYKVTDMISKVLRLIKNCTALEGISLQDLKQGLNGTSMPVIWQAVVFLKKEGCIYSTINMDHYKCSTPQDVNDMDAHRLHPNEKVLRLIKSCQAVEGISLQGLEERLGDMNLPLIWQAIESLSNEGFIYSTIDQYHYTSTDIINKVLMYIQFWKNGICIQDLAGICGRSLAVIKQAVESLIDDGLIFSPDDGWHYKLTDTIDKVLSLIKSSQDVNGISLQDMKQGLNGISMPAIWQAVVFLRKERHILDTIDMEHYMSTDTLFEVM